VFQAATESGRNTAGFLQGGVQTFELETEGGGQKPGIRGPRSDVGDPTIFDLRPPTSES
jgi:hypothetical protein